MTSLRSIAVAAALLAAAAGLRRCGARRPPQVPGAQAAIVVDARDGTVMFAKKPDAERSIASTTKLMTALLALEQAEPERRLHGAGLQRAAGRVADQPARRASG